MDEYTVIVELDEDGYYVGSVLELPGCHTQARSLDELLYRIKDAIKAYLEAAETEPQTAFIGIQRVRVGP
ncbi:MAG: type II toxin-antitoxin system HicB family antitoxin [Thermoprotei archaeon]|nr:MAG: type II toxin-antitoxin system HicB family antitoxin [Thermoprotei archaeon]